MGTKRWSEENFKIHLVENPEIYKLFIKYALQAAAVRNNYSARGIFHQIRWHTMVKEANSEFKVDNGWSYHYSRKFMEDYPEYKGFFRTRVRRNSYHNSERK